MRREMIELVDVQSGMKMMPRHQRWREPETAENIEDEYYGDAEETAELQDPGEPTTHVPHRCGLSKAVVFDFDSTLTVISEIPRHRVFCQEPDLNWLRQIAFGGNDRAELLLETLSHLRSRWGMELFVLSFAEKAIIARALDLLGVLQYFDDGAGIYGWQEIGGPFVQKSSFLEHILRSRGWQQNDVLLVDDQHRNLLPATCISKTYWVLGHGLSVGELTTLRDTGGSGLSLSNDAVLASEGATCGAESLASERSCSNASLSDSTS